MRGNPVTFREFTGGMDGPIDQRALAPKQALDALNIISDGGMIRTRDGSTKFDIDGGLGASSVSGLVGLEAVTGNRILGVVIGTSLSYFDTTGHAFAVAGLGSSGRWEWTQAPASGGQGPVYGSDGTNLRYVDPATGGSSAWTASTGTLHACKYLVTAGNRVWMTGDPSNPYRIYFSDIGDPRSWPAANVVDLEPFDSSPITGIARLGPYLIVAKERKLYAIYDFDTGANRQIADNIGCASHRSMVETAKGLMFLTYDQGVFVTDGSTTKPVMRNLYRRYPSLDPSTAAGVYWNNHYLLSVASAGSSNDITWDYDFINDVWWVHSFAVVQFALWRGAGKTQQVYGIAPTNGHILKMFVPGVTSDSSAAINSFWRSPFYDFNRSEVRKRGRGLRLEGSGTVDVSVFKDHDTSTVARTETGIVLPADPLASAAHVPVLGVARSFSAKVVANDMTGFRLSALTWAIDVRSN
jgi:hypothetical protein